MRLLSLSAFRKSLRPTNWLLRASGTRQWIKFRTFLNDHLPVDELQIIELDRDEIAWVRSVKIKTVYLTGPGDGRSNTHQTIKFLDIGLKHCDTDLLDAQLRIEEHHKGAGNHGIGSKSNNYPVSVPEPGVIRLLWSDQYGRIAPSVELAIQYFATWIRTRDPENLAVDYRPGAIANLPEIEQRRRMRELNRIDCFAANHLVQELRKCSLNESLRFLQEV